MDKTAVINELVGQGSVYFLSRPRRFGKSLLLSTLESLFLGRKALFEGLAIAKTDYDFTVYPVIRLDFSRVVVKQSDDLENYIINTANSMAKTHDIDLAPDSYEQMFSELVIKLQHKYQQKVVLLVDDYLGFVFITGVSKFAMSSVIMPMDGRYPLNAGSNFQGSGMNSLDDISMDSRYATICGITQSEMEESFSNQIETLGNQFGLSQVDNFEVDDLFFAAIEPEKMTPEPVLLQTGYLTIVDYDDGWYRLDFPNYEVKYAFNRAIVQEYGQTSAGDLRYVRNLCQALSKGDMGRLSKP